MRVHAPTQFNRGCDQSTIRAWQTPVDKHVQCWDHIVKLAFDGQDANQLDSGVDVAVLGALIQLADVGGTEDLCNPGFLRSRRFMGELLAERAATGESLQHVGLDGDGRDVAVDLGSRLVESRFDAR
jgi:hypothetical protein